jgi:hypothetical protein
LEIGIWELFGISDLGFENSIFLSVLCGENLLFCGMGIFPSLNSRLQGPIFPHS